MQLYARRHFLFPPLSIDVYNERVMSIVRCEAQVCKVGTNNLWKIEIMQFQTILNGLLCIQDLLLKKLLVENYLTEEERYFISCVFHHILVKFT